MSVQISCELSCFSPVWLFVTPWIVACQALPMIFPRQEYWSRLSFLSPGDLPASGIKPASLMSPALEGSFFTTCATWAFFFFSDKLVTWASMPDSSSSQVLLRSFILQWLIKHLGFFGGSVVRRIRQCRRHGFDPWIGRPPGGGNDNPLQYSYLGNSMAEEPGRLQPMGLPRVGHDWMTGHTLSTLSTYCLPDQRRKWQPTPVFLPGESQGQRSLVGCRLWGCT